jgi:putative transposase
VSIMRGDPAAGLPPVHHAGARRQRRADQLGAPVTALTRAHVSRPVGTAGAPGNARAADRLCRSRAASLLPLSPAGFGGTGAVLTPARENVTKKGPEPPAEQRAAQELVRRAQKQGLSLTGPGGLLKQLTKAVIETALDQELAGHLGHGKHAPAGNETGNVRNGSRPKTVLTESTGEVSVDVPRDRDGTFEPQIVKKRQRWLTWADEIVPSLCAKGLTTGEISAHFAAIYGASVRDETISRITGKVIEEMQSWQARPLHEVYAAVFTDAIMVKARDGRVASRPVYTAIGITLTGEKDVLGLWAGQGGEGAKFWMSVLTDLKNRGIRDVFFVVCDGLKGLPEVVGNAWPQAIVPPCTAHHADLPAMPVWRR